MYRLFSIRQSNLRNLSLCSSVKIKNTNPDRICSLCQKLHNLSNVLNTRFQSTYTNPSVVHKSNKTKKRRNNKRPYAELLVVTNESTVERKAAVTKLNPMDLKMFAKTDFNLGEFYKLKALKKQQFVDHTYHNLNVIENITSHEITLDSITSPPLSINKHKTSDLNLIERDYLPTLNDALDSETVDILENESGILENIKPTSSLGSFQPETLEDEVLVETEEVVEDKQDNPVLDETVRQEVVHRTLTSYIEVCSYLKAPQRGLNALTFHRSRVKNKLFKTFPAITNVHVYNALLKGFTAKEDFSKIEEVLRYANEDNIKLNVDSYAAIFECLGRVNCESNHLKQIRIYAKDAIRNGISFDHIMNDATFYDEQRALVLKAMNAYDPDYVMKIESPSVQYNNHLVNELNHPEQLENQKTSRKVKGGLFIKNNLQKLVNEQVKVEKQGYITIKSIEAKPNPSEEVMKYRQSFDEQLAFWEKAASTAFTRDLAALTARRSILNLDIYLRSIPIKDFIQIIVDEAKKIAQGSETYSPTCYQLYRDLGYRVYSKYKVLRKQKIGVLDKVMKVHRDYCNEYADIHGQLDVHPTSIDYVNTRQRWQWIEYEHRREGATVISNNHHSWVPTVLQQIGKFLYHIIMYDLKIDVNVMRNNSQHKNYLPAFYTIFRTQGRVLKEEVKPHPVLSKLYRSSVPETLTFAANDVPMRCPPVPWSSVNLGGYIVADCAMVRLPSQATTQQQRLFESTPNDIYPSLDSLNQLAAVPWIVNQKILDVILEVFNAGGSSKLDVPEPPGALPPPPSITANMDKSQRYLLFRQKLQHRRKRGEMYSLWCECLYRLSLANHFRNDIFWLPHNMDFRGRVYPIPPHLNHLGSDLARSMLVFGEARPLGPDGFDWLKLHLVNLTGLKKRDPIWERLIFANEIMDKILDSADNPLTGHMWWAESEEPWQTLACCMEIAAAHRSPDPEEFRSHFPVHQDGSCNGLQHYAALGRDSAGAHSVNLTRSSLPQDVYSAVVTLVEQQRLKDADNGLPIAKALDGFVKRKVIKQTIMTTVYGVTRFGARLQIARQLKDLDDFPKENVWAASSYLTSKTFESLRTMFTSTREIQDWFTECARLISSVCGENVEWVTPLGLPIVQPYNRYRKFSSSIIYEPFHMDKYEKPNVMKQKNAFPPNFIHSLDSSHMMLTSLHCERAGIVFVSVHDCYWTHPSTVAIMNKICREQFVALHSEPILENLSLFLTEKYGYNDSQFSNDGSVTDMTKRKLNRVLGQLPKTGDFNIKDVLNSVYFFS